ncbi:MAG: trimethylamine methyltransferase family protein [Anaerolineales bacterium]|nr:trimethylamine methyltransferase family protein [Anaerolineales bacterium]
MLNYHAQILSQDDKERIHAQSLRILEEVGVRFHGDVAPKVLREHGISIDPEEKIARLPAELVKHALEITPKSFVLGARNPAYSLELPTAVSRFCIDGTAAFAIDFHSGERRYGTLADIRDSLRIFQQMDLGVMAWAPTCAEDKPSGSRALHEFLAMARYCSKHGQHELHQVAQVPYLVEGLAAIMGSEDALHSSNAYSLIYCPVAPLTHDGQMLDAYLMLGEFGLPVMMMPMPVTGTTGPASLFSNIVVANAEALSTIVIYQLANPGRPLIYASATGIMDFRNGAYLAGVPEMALQSGALTEMGKYYGMPTGAAGCTSDAKQAGPEAVLEKFITTLPNVLAGSDIIVGYGEVESDQLLILEQIIVDNEIAHLCTRLAQGVDSSAEKDLFADIAQVGPGGHFLKAKSTRQAPRGQEFYMPRWIDHNAYEAWVELGKPSMYARARDEVERILAEPMVDPLPEAVEQSLDDILARADQDLGNAS